MAVGCDDFNKKAEQNAQERRGDDLAVEGASALQAGNYTEAIEKLEAALEKGLKFKEPDEIETTLGNAYMLLNENERAVEHHKKALALNPKNHVAMVNLGATYRGMGKLDEAEQMYEKARVLAPDYPELHGSLGALYIFQGKFAKGEASLRHALELDSTLEVGHANLSIALAEQGRFDEANESLATAEELGYRNGALLRRRIETAKLRRGAQSE